jgi:hypothetical protein
MLEIIEGAIENGQSKETGNMWYTRRRQTKHNTEKLATCGTQDEDKQNKNTTQYVLDTAIREQTNTNNVCKT